ncbi:hypothetical protein [Brucella sp. 2280]|uniref:hypothetical protein n=1 Tax=Brucella sp. 2280 TaxID=2592625 RepID=UPI001295864F|nr:hypothetical protein [Brucella sp. 2280]QGA56143.1 hypothetical protein GHC20_03170 [Brucella sp. 2280]
MNNNIKLHGTNNAYYKVAEARLMVLHAIKSYINIAFFEGRANLSFRQAVDEVISSVKSGTAEKHVIEAFHVANARRGDGRILSRSTIYEWEKLCRAAREAGTQPLFALFPKDGSLFKYENGGYSRVQRKLSEAEKEKRLRRKEAVEAKRQIITWLKWKSMEQGLSFHQIAIRFCSGEFTTGNLPEYNSGLEVLLGQAQERFRDFSFPENWEALSQQERIDWVQKRSSISMRTLMTWKAQAEKAALQAEREKLLSRARAKRQTKKSKGLGIVIDVEGQPSYPRKLNYIDYIKSSKKIIE